MKKRLILSLLLIAGLIANTSSLVNASQNYYYDNEEELYHKQLGESSRIRGFNKQWLKARWFGVKPIEENDEKIMVKTEPNSLIEVSKNDQKIQIKKDKLSLDRYNGIWKKIGEEQIYFFSGENGIATFVLGKEHAAKKGDKFTVSAISGGFKIDEDTMTIGQDVLDGEFIPDYIKKEEEDAKRKKEEQERLKKE